jgi:hypothetical protein
MMPVGGNVRAKIAAYRRACTKCRRRLKDRIQKEVGDYPKSRSTVAPPFYHVMLDIATGFRGQADKKLSGVCGGVCSGDGVHDHVSYEYPGIRSTEHDGRDPGPGKACR